MTTISELQTSELSAPTLVNGKVAPPRRRKNADVRSREHLTLTEVEQLYAAARRSGRYSLRDETLVHVAFQHGLRVSELVALKWEQYDRRQGRLHVNRLKRGVPSTHELQEVELRLLARLHSEQERAGILGPYVFVSERGGPMTASNVRKLVARLGKVAGIPFPIHPHVLRHACGHSLVQKPGLSMRQIQHYLGHRNITHTVRYTELSENALKGVSPG